MMTLFALLALQNMISAGTSFVNFVDGTASVALHQQVPAGTPIDTGSHSHVELMLDPGSMLRLGQDSKMVLDSVDQSEIHIHITQGEAMIESTEAGKQTPIHVRCGDLDTLILTPGTYLFTDKTATVLTGSLQVAGAAHPEIVKKGNQIASLAGSHQITPADSNAVRVDVNLWAQQRLKVSKDRAWQEGVLTGVTKRDSRAQIQEQQMQTGTGDKAIRYSITYEYTIQTPDKIYVAQIDAFNMGSPVTAPPIDLGATSNSPHVAFAIGNSKLYLQDKEGKEHQLGIVKEGARQN